MFDLAIIGAATAAVLMTIIISFAVVMARRESRADVVLARLANMERINEILGMPIRMNAAIQAMLVQKLTHYHTPDTDRLLAKLDPYTLTVAEEAELIAALSAREYDVNGRINDE